jgi:glycosyltransferase involved in cell wall biosynthesis
MRAKINNRIISGVPCHKLRTTPFLEWNALRLAGSQPTEEIFFERNRRFQEAIPNSEILRSDIVIGFDTSSWVLSERCRELSIPFVLDRSSPHPISNISVCSRLALKYPDWKHTTFVKPQKFLEIEELEHRLATRIVAASSFTKETLCESGVDPNKILVIPYGINLKNFKTFQFKQDRPFRFIYVGGINARKGVPDLLKAWQSLNLPNSELWLVGSINIYVSPLLQNIAGLCLKGQVAHRDMPSLYSQCDVLVFPSYFDGFGMVLLEALACGLYVITTEATGGPDVLTDAKAGVVVASGAVEDLKHAMRAAWIHRPKSDSKCNASRSLAKKFSWTTYGERWNALVHSLS